MTKIIDKAGLTIYKAPVIPTEKSEFWNELLTKLKVKLLSKELSLIDELKPNMISYHKNYKSGFIQITQNKNNLKIRIENNNWQIEKWSKENIKIKNTIKKIDYNSDFNVIKNEILNYII